MPITQPKINASGKAGEKEIVEPDGTVPGLIFRVTPAGTRTWMLRYRISGKLKKVVIGQYPAWGIADARERAK